MEFTKSALQDAWIIELESRGDERGYFARTFCRKEFEAHGLDATIAQSNTSYSRDAGTLRGMHYQKAPAEETKLMRCIRGSIFDVIIDLRPASSTYLQSYGIELSANNLKMLYIPKGFAHGFMTLEDHTEVLYMVGEYYTPDCEDGLRYNDPKFDIKWPREASVISDKDLNWPDFDAS
jgi:dTDP-4-dehydrorhamnose 3,5-epimerase